MILKDRRRELGIVIICVFLFCLGFWGGYRSGSQNGYEKGYTNSEIDFEGIIKDKYHIELSEIEPQANNTLLNSYLLIDIVNFQYMDDVEKCIYHLSVMDACSLTGINDPFLLYALSTKESSLNPRALSSAGAMGINQVMPVTARKVYKMMGWDRTKFKVHDLYDISYNVKLSALYLSFLIERYGNLECALSVYNGLPPYPSEYSKNVLSLRNELVENINAISEPSTAGTTLTTTEIYCP